MSASRKKTTQKIPFVFEKDEIEILKEKYYKTGKLPRIPKKTAIRLAQDIMYDAWETEDALERIKLAEDALLITKDCADAYTLLAEEYAHTPSETKKFYQKAVAAGERALGKQFFKKNIGHFWGIIEARPYMRARAGLARLLWETGEVEEAITHVRAMLHLNPSDNQGMRYELICYLANSKKYEELQTFLESSPYCHDVGVEWLYTKALLCFLREGDVPQAAKELTTALGKNNSVPLYLAGLRLIPQNLPGEYVVGSDDEAAVYACMFIKAWKAVPGAIEWLKRNIG
jgi:tetratricopeptide (TPR) repeat protein